MTRAGAGAGRSGAAVSVGVFDGVHLGHAEILRTALACARGGRCVVVTFDPHPDLVLSRTFRAPAPLTPLPEKRERLAALGIAEVDVVPFTRELSRLEPEEFVSRHLVRPYAPHTLVVGEGFALGRGRSGDVRRLRAIGEREGFDVVAVPLLRMDGGPVSSTRIRGLLEEGRVREAARLLGRRYDLAGLVVRGEAIGRRLGYPTANLRLHDEKLLPRDGVYAAWVRLDGVVGRRPGAVSIGLRPTFEGQSRAIEAHLLDWEEEVLGRELAIELVEWIRPQERFDSERALVAAMDADVALVRRTLEADAALDPR